MSKENIIGNRIRELRDKKQVSQEAVGKYIDVSTSLIGMYEIGSRKPSIDILIKLANYFDVSTDYLLGRTDEPVIDPKHIYAAVDTKVLKNLIDEEKKKLRERIMKALEE